MLMKDLLYTRIFLLFKKQGIPVFSSDDAWLYIVIFQN